MRLALVAVALLLLPSAAAQGPGPYSVHLGLDTAGERIVVAWSTRAPSDTTVVVRDADGAEVGRFIGGTTTFPQGASFLHEVPLEGLAPGSYTYTLGEREFPLHIPPAGPAVKLAFIGDMGITSEAAANVARLLEEQPAAVFHAGDISYAEGDPAEWDRWFAQVEPVASGIPWLPALGNHETYNVPMGLDGATSLVGLNPRAPTNPEVDAYRVRFSLPGNELYWSWTVGGVHIAAIDTFFTGFESGSPQAAWLAEDLAAHANATWTIVLLHEPPFSSNAAHGSSEALRAVLAPILDLAGVDLVVSGHDHSYERTWPLVAATPASRNYTAGAGVVYTVSGGGGNGLYTSFEDPAPEWSAMRAADYQTLLVEANATALVVRSVRPDGSLLDTFTIAKPMPPAPPVDDPVPVAIPGVAGLAALGVLAVATLLRRR